MPSPTLGVAVQLLTSAADRWIGMPLPVAVISVNTAPVDPRCKTCVERSTNGERAERSPAGVAG